MKQKHQQNTRAKNTNQTQIGPSKATIPEPNGSTHGGEKPPWYYKVERWTFMPVKADPAWSQEQDIREYVARFGESDHPLRDTRLCLERNLADLHRVLTLGIKYFLQKDCICRLAPVSGLSLREKVELFTDLLPNSSNTDYVLRFTTTLARILWLDSENRRVLAQRDRQPWLYPLYHLADCIATATCVLEEALSCEHDDFDKDRLQEEDDDGVPEEVEC